MIKWLLTPSRDDTALSTPRLPSKNQFDELAIALKISEFSLLYSLSSLMDKPEIFENIDSKTSLSS